MTKTGRFNDDILYIFFEVHFGTLRDIDCFSKRSQACWKGLVHLPGFS